jgi:hypothetical protein
MDRIGIARNMQTEYLEDLMTAPLFLSLHRESIESDYALL